jgi:hypothetical protein
VRATVVSLESRIDFAASFGISVDDQIMIEQWYARLSPEQLLGLAPPREVPLYNYDK